MKKIKNNKKSGVLKQNHVDKTIKEIRAFNRYYTGIIGVLNKHYLNSQFSLPEARIIFEIQNNPLCTSKKIISIMNIDRGYLSRILKQFYYNKVIIKKHCRDDARIVYLSLTSKGRKIFARLNSAQNKLMYSLINTLNVNEQKKLVGHMEGIKKILSNKPSTKNLNKKL